MRRSVLRKLSLLALSATAGLAVSVPVAAADPITKLQQGGGAPYVIYLVKDLGGGAYWNVTTNSLYVVAAGSEALVGAAQATGDLLATGAADGRDLLLLINGAVIVPITNRL
ncbi:MAG: hypothetical protein JWP14_1412 [Frankiales bacterium]|jgi:hypothetical protein|nr:hypothetical protein [Frankiales bacterium]